MKASIFSLLLLTSLYPPFVHALVDKECIDFVVGHVATNPPTQPLSELNDSLSKLELATVLVRVQLNDSPITIPEIKQRLVVEGLQTPEELQIIKKGELFFIAHGPRAALKTLNKHVDQNFKGEPGHFGFQILDAPLADLQVSPPAQMLNFTEEPNQATDDKINSVLARKKETIGVLDIDSGTPAFFVPKKDLSPLFLVGGDLPQKQNIEVRVVDEDTSQNWSAWLRSYPDVFHKKIAVVTPDWIVLSQRSYAAINKMSSGSDVTLANITPRFRNVLRRCFGPDCPTASPETPAPPAEPRRSPGSGRQSAHPPIDLEVVTQISDFLRDESMARLGYSIFTRSSALPNILLDIFTRSGGSPTDIQILQESEFGSSDINNMKQNRAAAARVMKIWRRFRDLVEPEKIGQDITAAELPATIAAYRKLTTHGPPRADATPEIASPPLNPDDDENLPLPSKFEDQLNPSDVRIIFQFLRSHAKIAKLSDPNGIRRAFLDYSIQIEKGPLRTEFIGTINNIGFRLTEYGLLSTRSPSSKAIENMGAGWRAILKAKQIREWRRSINSQVLAASVEKLTGTRPSPIITEEPIIADPVVSDSDGMELKYYNGTTKDLEKWNLTSQAQKILSSFTGVIVPAGTGPLPAREMDWTLLFSKAKDNGQFRTYALIALISHAPDETLRIHRIIEASDETERFFWRYSAEIANGQAQLIDLKIQMEEGGEWAHRVEVSVAVALRLHFKHDVDVNNIQSWMNQYRIGQSKRTPEQAVAYNLEPLDRKLRRLRMIIAPNGGGNYKLVTIHPMYADAVQ